jgi:hypothetical protein
VVDPAGTATIAEFAVAEVGGTSGPVPNRTRVGVALNVPVIVTTVPIAPDDGEKDGVPGHVAVAPVLYENADDGPVVFVITTGFEVLALVPPAIRACSWVSASRLTMVPAVPPNEIALAGPPFEMKFEPVIVTWQPGEAFVGNTCVIVGTTA